jgi:FixJ family two-component response regulator
VDDDAAVRSSLTALLSSVGLSVQASARPETFLETYRRSSPECVVLDLRMPGMSGLEVFERLKQRAGAVPTIFITAHGEVSSAVQAMKAGAIEFLEKPFSHQLFLDRVFAALAADVDRKQEAEGKKQVEERIARLTERERTILALVIRGLSSKMMASQLGISLKTVEAHRTSIMQKIGARNAPDLVRLALTAGFAPSREEDLPLEVAGE